VTAHDDELRERVATLEDRLEAIHAKLTTATNCDLPS
jgi:hypothetical protein